MFAFGAGAGAAAVPSTSTSGFVREVRTSARHLRVRYLKAPEMAPECLSQTCQLEDRLRDATSASRAQRPPSNGFSLCRSLMRFTARTRAIFYALPAARGDGREVMRSARQLMRTELRTRECTMYGSAARWRWRWR